MEITANVTMYGIKGWIEDLPNMQYKRAEHGCTSYLSMGKRVKHFYDDEACIIEPCTFEHMLKVLIVAGGRIEESESTFTSISTELFDPELNYWRLIDGKLPSSKSGLRMITTSLDDVLVFGINMHITQVFNI